eukprot:1121362-Prymnesium_polylepis.1
MDGGATPEQAESRPFLLSQNDGDLRHRGSIQRVAHTHRTLKVLDAIDDSLKNEFTNAQGSVGGQGVRG